MPLSLPPIPILVLQFLVLILAITVHEFCHAYFADMAGDDLPRLQGRVTLNPLAHLDPVGTIMMLFTLVGGFGIGWGRPVMVRPEKMKNPRWDHFNSVIAGPLSNLLQAVLYALVLKFALGNLDLGVIDSDSPTYGMFRSIPEYLAVMCFFGVLINLNLFVFNLVPLGPLDGHWLVGAFLPDKVRIEWYRFNRGPGMIIFLALVLLPPSWSPLKMIVFPCVKYLFALLTGFHLM